jgi:hypothetical protein
LINGLVKFFNHLHHGLLANHVDTGSAKWTRQTTTPQCSARMIAGFEVLSSIFLPACNEVMIGYIL